MIFDEMICNLIWIVIHGRLPVGCDAGGGCPDHGNAHRFRAPGQANGDELVLKSVEKGKAGNVPAQRDQGGGSSYTSHGGAAQ